MLKMLTIFLVLTSNLAISVKGVTIDGGENHYKIYADDGFNQAIAEGLPGDSSVNSLVTVTGDNLTLKNITLETGKKNAHVLNLMLTRARLWLLPALGLLHGTDLALLWVRIPGMASISTMVLQVMWAMLS